MPDRWIIFVLFGFFAAIEDTTCPHGALKSAQVPSAGEKKHLRACFSGVIVGIQIVAVQIVAVQIVAVQIVLQIVAVQFVGVQIVAVQNFGRPGGWHPLWRWTDAQKAPNKIAPTKVNTAKITSMSSFSASFKARSKELSPEHGFARD